MTTRLKGRQIDYLGDTPAYLQDMKVGEVRVTEDGVYARYGPQIRKLRWDETPISTTTTTTTTTTSTFSTTSSTASTATTASTLSTTSTTGVPASPEPPLVCGVLYEPFTGTGFVPPNPALWIELDVPGILGVDNNRLEKRLYAEQTEVHIRSIFDIAGGDYDCQVKIHVESANIDPGLDNDQHYEWVHNTGKNNWTITLSTDLVTGIWQIEGFLSGLGPVPVWSRPDLTPPFDLWFRQARVGNVHSIYVWNPILSQWEWDGNPAGVGADPGFSAIIDSISHKFWDGEGAAGQNAWFGWLDDYCINIGTLI